MHSRGHAIRLWDPLGAGVRRRDCGAVADCSRRAVDIHFGTFSVRNHPTVASSLRCAVEQYSVAKIKENAARRWATVTHVHWYFLSLLMSELVQAIGAIIPSAKPGC